MSATRNLQHLRSESTAANAAQPTVVAGRYALMARLGRGRFGEIYECIDVSQPDSKGHAARVAIQVIRSSVLNQAPVRDRFKEGFARIRSWSHPNIVKLLELGRDGMTFYETMELLEGASVRRILDDVAPGTVDPAECYAVVCQTGRALSHAHERGVVHGDVRAENVFVTNAYAVKLLDFAPIPVSPAAVLVEDPASRKVPLATARDDVYGLACLAYELLTGRHPYGGSLRDEARQAGLRAEPVAGLTTAQWHALERGISYEARDDDMTIDELVHGLGITGTENLPVADTIPVRAEPAPVRRTQRAAPGAYDDWESDVLRAERPVRTGPGVGAQVRHRRRYPVVRTATLLLIAVGAGVMTYRNYDEYREIVADWFVEYAPNIPLVAVPEETPTIDGTAWAPVAGEPVSVQTADESTASSPAANAVAAAAAGSESSRVPSAEAAAGSVTERSVEREPAEATAGDARVPKAVVAAAPVTESPAVDTRAPTEDVPVEATASAGSASAAIGPASIALADAGTTVSESGTAARIVIRKDGDPRASIRFEWWASDDTAVRDDDYGDLGRREETFPAGETTMTLLVPIVADLRTESNERFFVNIVVAPTAERSTPLSLQTTVVIVDDDY